LPDGRAITDPTVTIDQVRTALIDEVQRQGRITDYAKKLSRCLGLMSAGLPVLPRIIDSSALRNKGEESLYKTISELTFFALLAPVMKRDPKMTVVQAMKQLNWLDN
jgi:hypothetical protein